MTYEIWAILGIPVLGVIIEMVIRGCYSSWIDFLLILFGALCFLMDVSDTIMLPIQIIAPLAGIWKEVCTGVMEKKLLGLKPCGSGRMLVPTSLSKLNPSTREGSPLSKLCSLMKNVGRNYSNGIKPILIIYKNA